MNDYLFYPGCSLTRSARPYLDSLRAIEGDLALALQEVPDWNCCGATEYASVHRLAACALIGRNLALAAQHADGHATRTLVAACSACYLNLAKTEHHLRHDAALNRQVGDALAAGGLHYTPGTLQIRHLLDIFCNDIGLAAIRARVTRPLAGLRVAPYYGCMIVRPDPDQRFDNPEYPTALDKLLVALGATVVDYPLKTHCCGGHMTQISPPTAYAMIQRLVAGAARNGADLIATLCPMCQLNLDAFQSDMNNYCQTDFQMPVVYFTQLIGLAFGHAAEALGLGREFVDVRPALAKIGIPVVAAEPAEEQVAAAAAAQVAPVRPARPPASARAASRAARRRKGDRSLPMPRMAPPAGEEVPHE